MKHCQKQQNKQAGIILVDPVDGEPLMYDYMCFWPSYKRSFSTFAL